MGNPNSPLPTLGPPSEDRGPSLVYERIKLAPGVRAEVLVGCSSDVASVGRLESMPEALAWRAPLLQVCRSPEDHLEEAEVLKDSSATRVVRGIMTVGRTRFDVVCKQFRRPGWASRMAEPIGLSRGGRNRRAAVWLLKSGLSTAAPLARVRVARPVYSEWLVSEAIPETVDLDRIALTELDRLKVEERHEVKESIGETIAEYLATMRQWRLHHRDLKASNILITHWHSLGYEPRVWIVDLDGLRKKLWRPRPEHQLTRLAASLIGYAALSSADYARFLKAYGVTAFDDAAWWRWAYGPIATHARAYVSKAFRRKRGKLDGYTGGP